MLKALGFLFLFIASTGVCKLLADRRLHALITCEECVRFVSYLRIRIGCYLEPIDVAAASFKSDVFSSLGLDKKIKELGPYAAFSEMGQALPLTPDVRRLMLELCENLGSGYVDDELKLIDSYIAELSRIKSEAREKIPNENKLVTTLISGAVLGLIILFL